MTFILSPAAFIASGKAWQTPWSVIAMAGCPHEIALLITAFGSVSASIVE